MPSFIDHAVVHLNVNDQVSEPQGFKNVDTAWMDGHIDGHLNDFTSNLKRGD